MNFSYLVNMSKNIRVPVEIRRCYPWILWLIWKNRNKFIFEAREQRPEEIIFDEASSWFMAQQLDRDGAQRDEQIVKSHQKRWTKPPRSWVKCNYGIKWLKAKKVAGVAWILRDNCGESLMHSRKSLLEFRH